jgi:Asp-tRNA(Asn)/Glu-tRNA(Gln) amidotransferase A subunit family amidase
MSDDATSPVTAVANAVVTGRARAHEMVAESLRRIARDDPGLNAVVALRADEALREAEALDRSIRAGARVGPLAGVPVLVKDLEDVAGMRTTYGSLLFANQPPAATYSLIPARLQAAGAIIVGKTNLPEFATEGYTANRLFGTTGNPWAPELSPGGSSGGSAAAVAAGMVPIATATDGGGSIRIPASFCGLVGIKPTLGVIPRYPAPDWIDFSTAGPMATSVRDLRRLFAVEAGPEMGDPSSLPDFSTWPAFPPPGRLFAAHRTSDLGPLPTGVAQAFETAVAALADVLALEVIWLDPRQFFPDGDPDLDWFTLATAEHVAALGRDRVSAGLELMHPGARAFMEQGLAVSIGDYLEARRRRFGYVHRLDELLGKSDVLLTPTVASEGWYADGRLTRGGEPAALPAEVYSTALQNVTGHPAISVPAGQYKSGLPFGLQITGLRFSDGQLLDMAEAWERANPWPAVAPGFSPFAASLA